MVLHPWSILYVCVASVSFIHTRIIHHIHPSNRYRIGTISCNLFDFNISFMLFQQQAFDPLFQNHHTHIYMERLNKINQIDMEKRHENISGGSKFGFEWGFKSFNIDGSLNMFAFSLGWLSIPSIFQEVRRQNAMMELQRV
jgi:hypothetical protein